MAASSSVSPWRAACVTDIEHCIADNRYDLPNSVSAMWNMRRSASFETRTTNPSRSSVSRIRVTDARSRWSDSANLHCGSESPSQRIIITRYWSGVSGTPDCLSWWAKFLTNKVCAVPMTLPKGICWNGFMKQLIASATNVQALILYATISSKNFFHWINFETPPSTSTNSLPLPHAVFYSSAI